MDHLVSSFSDFPPQVKMNAPSTLLPPPPAHAPPSIKEERREAIRRHQDKITYAERSTYALPRNLKKAFDEAKGDCK